MGLVVFSPLAGGVLTGKYLSGRPAGTRAASGPWLDGHLTRRRVSRVRRFVALARSFGTEPATLALAWVIGQPGIAAAITGATSVAQLEANLRAAEHRIPPELLAHLERIFPVLERPSWLRGLARWGRRVADSFRSR